MNVNKKFTQALGVGSIFVGALDLKSANDATDPKEIMAFRLMGVGAICAGVGALVMATTLEAPASGNGLGGPGDDPIGPFDPAPHGIELEDDPADVIDVTDPDSMDAALEQVMGEAERENEDVPALLGGSYGPGDDLA